jgi:predicted RecA/RadA family phage recombinase
MAAPTAKYRHGEPVMVDYTPTSAVTAGDVILQGVVPMVAHKDIAANKLGSLASRGGVYRLTPAAAIAVGKTVWWDVAAKKVTETATSNAHFGYTVIASFSGDTLVDVQHSPVGIVGAI